MATDQPQQAPGQPQWYASVGGQAFGPADKTTLSQWATEGRLPRHAQVVLAGTDAWRPIADVSELQDLPFRTRSLHTGAPLPPKAAQVAVCPRCGGAVANVAPSYGIFFGVMEKSILPKLRCADCGVSLAIDHLHSRDREAVRRTRNRSLIIWLLIVIPATGILIYLMATQFSIFR